MARKIVAVLLSVLVLSLLSLTWWFADEKLSEDSERLIAELETWRSQPSEQYSYLMGIHSPEGQSPEILGVQRVQYWLQYDQLILDAEEIAAVVQAEPQVKEVLALPKKDEGFNCSFGVAECLTQNLRSDHSVAFSQYGELLARYRHFLSLDDLHVPTVSVQAELPKYEYLIAGNRLSLLQYAEQADAEVLVTLIMGEIQATRRMLAVADDIVLKLIAVNMVHEQLEFLTALAVERQLPVPALPPLSQAERSLDRPLLGFSLGQIEMLQQLFDSYAREDGSEQMTGWDALIRLVPPLKGYMYQPNRSMNLVSAFHRQVAHVSENLPAELAQKLDELESDSAYTSTLPSRNVVPYLILNIAQPSFTDYIIRVRALEAKIALFNNQCFDESCQITNLFESGKGLELRDERICMPLPRAIDKPVNCLLLW